MTKIFNIRNEKSETSEKKLAGVMLPQQIFNYLSLYALAKGYSKSLILRMIIQDWCKGNEESLSGLIDEIVIKINKEWKMQKILSLSSPHGKATKEIQSDFIKQLEADLTSKGILREYIDQILNKIEI